MTNGKQGVAVIMVGNTDMRKPILRTAAALLFIGVAIQFVQPQRTNPPVDAAISFERTAKPAPKLAAILRRACNDCHSNETVWPWYSGIAPGSWLIARDVAKGRKHLNFSEWGRLSDDSAENRIGEICQEAQGGSMPPWQYRLLHPKAKLTKDDVSVLCAFPTAYFSGGRSLNWPSTRNSVSTGDWLIVTDSENISRSFSPLRER